MRWLSLSGGVCSVVVACGGGSSQGSPGQGLDGGSSGGGVDAGTNVGGDVPVIGGCPIFPADNPWNTRIDDPTKFPVSAQWATYQGTMNVTKHLHPD